MLRRAILLWLALAGCTLVSLAAEPSGERHARVEIAPTKTSIYIGTVSMTMPTFTRTNGTYESTYVAKVFPFFFYGEQGKLAIDVSEDQLQKLARGEAIEFTGKAVNSKGEERRIEAKATPADGNSGKLKVRVFVSKKIELIFNTTYRFPQSVVEK